MYKQLVVTRKSKYKKIYKKKIFQLMLAKHNNHFKAYLNEQIFDITSDIK